MQLWQLQYVKSHLSEVVRLCLKQGPQGSTVRGNDTAVLMSKKDYEKLAGIKPDFVTFMQNSPLKGLAIPEFART